MGKYRKGRKTERMRRIERERKWKGKEGRKQKAGVGVGVLGFPRRHSATAFFRAK